MPKSFNLYKILSRLKIRGTVHSTSGSGDKYQHYVATLGSNGKLHSSVVPAADAEFGDVDAENVTFITPPSKDPSVTNVRDAINNITKDSGGLAVMRDKNLTDLADPEIGFNTIKTSAAANVGGNVHAGTVGLANQAAIEAGTASGTDASSGSTPLVVTAAMALANFVNKFATSPQTILSPLALPDVAPAASHAVRRDYLDAALLATFQVATTKTIWVDPVNGSDVTGEKGNLNKSVATLARAKQLAASGDLVVVFPGTYNENNLGKNEVNWFFYPGARVQYTSGGDFNEPIFSMTANEACRIMGYGDFANLHPNSSSAIVFNVTSGGKLVMEANTVHSRRDGIYANCGETGYFQGYVRDSVISDALDASGGRAARLLSGTCTLTVGRLIHSIGTANGMGIQLGAGHSSPSIGTQVVYCPRITGVQNAIQFSNSARAEVFTSICTATLGPAIKVVGGTYNHVSASGYIQTTGAGHSTILSSNGKLALTGGEVRAFNEQPPIYLNAGPYSDDPPYLILNNTQIFVNGESADAIVASTPGLFKARIIGSVQSDCAQPNTIDLVGGTWDTVLTEDWS